MKKFFKIFGWIFLGIFLQFKFNALYGIVFLENLNFHDRTYRVKIDLTPAEAGLSILNVDTVVHHSLGSDYFANVYIPDHYNVLNLNPYKGAEAFTGYRAYQMDMKRKYRDVLSRESFIISPKNPNQIPPTPIIVHFENLKTRLHTDETYHLSTANNNTRLQGPPLVEATYPQELGM